MEHNEYIRAFENSENAVLMVHGFLGTPRHFDAFLPLIPDDWSVYNVLLDGHGGAANDFAKTSMKKWRTQIKTTLDKICENHKNVYIIAHSLGTLLSIEFSASHQDRIKAMLLLACPLKVKVAPKILKNLLNIIFDRVDESDPYALATKNATSVKTDKRLWIYFGYIPRFIELLAYIKVSRKNILSVDVPCHVFQSGKDELVSKKALKYIKANDKLAVSVLEGSGHFYYTIDDFKQIEDALKNVL